MKYSMTPQHHTSEQEPSKKLFISASGAVYASVPSALFGSLFTCGWQGSRDVRPMSTDMERNRRRHCHAMLCTLWCQCSAIRL